MESMRRSKLSRLERDRSPDPWLNSFLVSGILGTLLRVRIDVEQSRVKLTAPKTNFVAETT